MLRVVTNVNLIDNKHFQNVQLVYNDNIIQTDDKICFHKIKTILNFKLRIIKSDLIIERMFIIDS